MTQCCGYGKCTNSPTCEQRGYQYQPPKQQPESKIDGYGWFLIVALSLLCVPLWAVIAKPFGTVAPFLFLIGVVGFPCWAIWYGEKD